MSSLSLDLYRQEANSFSSTSQRGYKRNVLRGDYQTLE